MALRRAYVDRAVSGGRNANDGNGGDRKPLLLAGEIRVGLIEVRSDEGPAGVKEDGDADGEGEVGRALSATLAATGRRRIRMG
jgi:hypothetical protein